MRKFINRDPVGQIIHSHPQIRRKLKAKLRSTYERLKAAAP
jgi:CRP-like cAMP-binding protein